MFAIAVGERRGATALTQTADASAFSRERHSLHLIETIWWLGFCTAVGLCLGSFLNVVIYRLPRDRSLRKPLWSACPTSATAKTNASPAAVP